jgi:hypothetical protein
MSLLSSWFRNLLAFENTPVKQEFSIADPTSADPKGLNTVTLAVSPSDGQSPTMVSLFFEASGVKLFEKQYQDDQAAQTEVNAIANDLNEAATLSKEGKIDEAKNLVSSLIEKYKRASDTIVQPTPTPTMTQASQNAPLVYKGFLLKKLADGSWQASQDELAFTADSIDSVKAKVDNMLRKAYGKKLAKRAEIVMQNLFFSTPDEAMEYQEKMKKLQGPETGEGKPLWEQMGNGEQVAPSNESIEEVEDENLAPSSLSFDRIEKSKAQHDKDIGKRIKEQVKTEVESALEQKSASVFGSDQEELVEALRKNGRNWDEIKKIFTKELSYNEDDTTVFLDSIRQKEEGGPAEGLPLPPKPPEDLVSPETHDKLVKEIEDKSEPKPEPLPLEDEIARADNAEIRKVAGEKCLSCGSEARLDHEDENKKYYKCDKCHNSFPVKKWIPGVEYRKTHPKKSSLNIEALNPLQEPPAVGQTPGQPLAAPVEEAPTFDSPVPPSQDSNPEPEFLEAPQAGDRVYVMGDYETGEDGYEGTMVSDYTSKGDEYAVIAKDNGDNAEVALHRVVKASQKKVAKAYYEKTATEDIPENQQIRNPGSITRRPPPPHGDYPASQDKEPEKEADLEVESKSNEDVIRMFIDNSFPKDKMPVWGTTNLKISKYPNGWALVNYQTPILYRDNASDTIYFNTQKYSPTTSKIQTQMRRNFTGQPVKETDEAGIVNAIARAKSDITKELNPDVKELPLEKNNPTDFVGIPEVESSLQSLHESALKLQAELEHEGEVAFYFTKEGIEKQASGDSAFEANGWCRVWVQDIEIESDKRYPEILKLADETARVDALKDLARNLAHEALQLADSAAGKVGVQAWFESLTPSDHDRIDWDALANPTQENVESAQDPKIEKKALWQDHIQTVYNGDFDQFLSFDRMYGLHERLGFPSAEELWETNPVVQGSTNPDDYKVVAQEKQAADPVPPAEGPKEIPTQFKQLERAPAKTEREKAQPATEEQAKLVQEMQSSLSSLEAIKSMVTQAKAKVNEEIKNIEQQGGRVQIESELKEKMERLAKLVEATENQMINAGDTVVRLMQETKEKPFKPSDAWKVQKLVEKFAGAQEYLDKAIAGAQSLATTEQVRDLVFFPRKSSQSMKLSKKANFIDTLDSVYNDVLAALKLIIGSEEPAVV